MQLAESGLRVRPDMPYERGKNRRQTRKSRWGGGKGGRDRINVGFTVGAGEAGMFGESGSVSAGTGTGVVKASEGR
jgi:hypothetical protein